MARPRRVRCEKRARWRLESAGQRRSPCRRTRGML